MLSPSARNSMSMNQSPTRDYQAAIFGLYASIAISITGIGYVLWRLF